MNPPRIIHHSEIEGLIELQCDYFQDERGVNVEPFNLAALPPEFDVFRGAVASSSISRLGVLRGAHGDTVSHKLITLGWGRIQFCVYDARPESKTFGASKEFIVNALQFRSFFLKPGMLNAHLCLSEFCKFDYLWSAGYIPIEKQIHKNYKELGIDWLILNPITSKRDS